MAATRLPPTARLARILVAAMDATVPGGAATAQEAVPRQVPSGEPTDAVRDPPILVAPPAGAAGAAPRPTDAIASARGPPKHAPLETVAVRAQLVAGVGPATQVPQAGRGAALIGPGARRGGLNARLAPHAGEASVPITGRHPRVLIPAT